MKQNGKLLRSLKYGSWGVSQLGGGCPSEWSMASFNLKNASGNSLAFEDCTTQFFPPALGVPRMPGLAPGDAGLIDKVQDSFVELSNSSKQCLHSLCSGDIDGVLHFSIFGVFLIENIVSVLSVRIKYLAIRSVIFSK